jgi:hypothetical protein
MHVERTPEQAHALGPPISFVEVTQPDQSVEKRPPDRQPVARELTLDAGATLPEEGASSRPPPNVALTPSGVEPSSSTGQLDRSAPVGRHQLRTLERVMGSCPDHFRLCESRYATMAVMRQSSGKHVTTLDPFGVAATLWIIGARWPAEAWARGGRGRGR